MPALEIRSIRRFVFAAMLVCTLVSGAHAQDVASRYPQARTFFPEADRFGDFEGVPPAAPVYRGDQLQGYLFLTNDVVQIPAYSGKPINTLVGFDLGGRITGIAIVHHEEPILAVGISEARLKAFTDEYRGKSVFVPITVGAPRAGYAAVDTISGATITAMVQNATITKSVRRVAESRGLHPGGRVAPHAVAPAGSVANASEAPLWMEVWRDRKVSVVLLLLGLGVLSLILIFQDWLARRPRLLWYVRRGFLLFTLFFIGWYALAQLSVMQVLTFLHAAMRNFQWENFLIDPMLFILWGFVALTLLLWGRGVYCGWLCPYGALQELGNQVARWLGVKQLEFPDVVHERLSAVKYLVLIMLFGVSLQSLVEAARYAEVEPFKTTIVLHFVREWPFVLYSGALLVVAAFNRKFFCKYLCPLGAALAIPGRFRVFDWWLRRRKECGRPCQTCAQECEVRAIRPTGEINANECHYCLDCQVTYYNERKCMPLLERAKRRERASRAREVVQAMEPHAGPMGLDEHSEPRSSRDGPTE
jgi:NosR/NirI family transcriptional regulator, nitrous oxide reductase regulator